MGLLGWIIYIIVVVAVGYGGGTLLGRHRISKEVGPKWVAYGQQDALRDHRRFDCESKWLQKHYDRGYNSINKEAK